jgi:hypothetical protein
MGVARVVSSAGNYALRSRAGRRLAGVPSDRKIGQVANRIVQLDDVLQTYHEGIAFLPARLRAVKLPRAILIVNPIASAKDTLACDSCNVWRVIENPQFAFHVLVAGMFRAVDCRQFRH